MLLRNLLSFLSSELQTMHEHAIMGTPLLVPVPKKVILSGGAVKGARIRNLGYQHRAVHETKSLITKGYCGWLK
jgi:hypothetical protein